MLYKNNAIKENDFSMLDDEGIISGYASVFNNVDSDGDVMAKGAFRRTLDENKDRIAFLYQHDMRQPIGKPKIMEEDDIGLKVEAKVSDSSQGKDIRTMIKEGILKEFSVGFIPMKEEEIIGFNTFKEVKLFEFSLVTLAANPLATVTGFKGTKTVENAIEQFDRLIKCCRKLDNPHLLEYELRVLREKFSLISDQSLEKELAREKAESDKITAELNNFLKELK